MSTTGTSAGTRFLHFGPGPNELPEPWENLDPSHDIRKRLRFEDSSVSGILAEHVIEHVPFVQGLGFLGEAWRVLEPRGVLRLAFPDVSRFLYSRAGTRTRALVPLDGESDYILNTVADTYAVGLSARPSVRFVPSSPSPTLTRAALYHMLTGFGHQAAWTEDLAAAALIIMGFSVVKRCGYGCGQLRGVDGHHREVGLELAKLESTILEAYK